MMLIINNFYLRLTTRRIHGWRVIVARSLDHFIMVNIMIICILALIERNYDYSYKTKDN